QTEIFNGIQNTLEASHKDGYHKVVAVEDRAQLIQITSNPLKDVSRTEDRTGICHQLSNNGKIDWKQE
ncbi:MAG: hypothetical protein IT215_07155, partial [Chitinophagaceae bacterium]|nr:hypothetical protein [Chitinophagaceae bacterium]